jgi:1A family penicillin-binding protein
VAKKKRRKIQRAQARKQRDTDFFEALPMMATLATPVTVPTEVDDSELVTEQNQRQFPGFVRAGLHDAGVVLRAIGGGLIGKRARIVYLILLLSTAVAGVTIATLSATATMSVYNSDISSPAALLAKKKTGITILDRNGTVLYRTAGAGTGDLTPMGALPESFKEATLAAEDPNFYQHDGVSLEATTRAVLVDITHREDAQGGSTLTQQLVKNALLTSTKSFARKYQEIVLSDELEHRYSKDQIFEMYVSEVPYGQSTYGVEEASEVYFHKPPKDLDLAQSALLAGMPLGPSRFDPTVDPAAAKQRRDYVLDRMVALKMVTAAQANAAKAEPIVASARDTTILAPHFVFYVLNQLQQQYGDDFEDLGLTVTTTLDLKKQNLAQLTVTNQIANLASHHVTNGGLISLDPSNGDILAMVGSIDYNQPDFGAVNVTTSLFQPGSSFKPFAYVTAFEKGWNGATVVNDTPTTYTGADGSTYTPEDYDLKFRGPVTLRSALDQSLNIPATKVLQFAGIPATLQTASDLGITTLTDTKDYGLSLVLGAGDVEPIQMAAAYGAFATDGQKVTPRAILKVQDKLDKVTMQAPATVVGPSVLDPRYAYMITSILTDNKARTPEFGANSPLLLSRPDAAKTGTTNDFDDNWTVGYTPNLVTAVWVGNNDHTPMEGVDGITGAAPIWHDYMEGALSDMPVENFAQPLGITMEPVGSNGCPAPNDPNATGEAFITDTGPTPNCGQPLS